MPMMFSKLKQTREEVRKNLIFFLFLKSRSIICFSSSLDYWLQHSFVSWLDDMCHFEYSVVRNNKNKQLHHREKIIFSQSSFFSSQLI